MDHYSCSQTNTQREASIFLRVSCCIIDRMYNVRSESHAYYLMKTTTDRSTLTLLKRVTSLAMHFCQRCVRACTRPLWKVATMETTLIFFYNCENSVSFFTCQIRANWYHCVEHAVAEMHYPPPNRWLHRQFGGAHDVMVIVDGNGPVFKSWTRLFAFHAVLILWGKEWIQLFSL